MKRAFARILLAAVGSAAAAIVSAAAGGQSTTPSVIYEAAEIRTYSDGSPCIHDIFCNRTEKTVVEVEYSMLAYDETGAPLELDWNFMDSSTERAYLHTVRADGRRLLPGQVKDLEGGWSLEDGREAERIAYVLFCPKQLSFEDGSIWENPDYAAWQETWEGKNAEVPVLEAYYPAEFRMEK